MRSISEFRHIGQHYAQNSYTRFSLTAYRMLHYLQTLRDRFPGIWVTSVSPGDQSSYLRHAFGIASRSIFAS